MAPEGHRDSLGAPQLVSKCRIGILGIIRMAEDIRDIGDNRDHKDYEDYCLSMNTLDEAWAHVGP